MANIPIIDDEPGITVALRIILDGEGPRITEAGEKSGGIPRA